MRYIADGVDYSNVNQLVKNGNFENGNYWYDNGTNHTISNNVIKITATVTGTYRSVYYYPLTITANHKYYIGYEAKSNVSSLTCGIGANGEYWTDSFTATQNWQHFGKVTNLPNANGETYIYIVAQNITDELHCRNVMLIDLTKIYGSGNEPSTVAQVRQDLCITDNTYIPYNLYGNGKPSIKKRVVANCGVYTFTGNELWGIGSTNNANKKRWQLTIDGLKFETNSSLLANLHIDGLTTVSADNNYFCTEGVCSNNSNSRIYIYLDAYNSADKLDDFKQFMAGKTLYYETIQYQPRKIANCGCVDLGTPNYNSYGSGNNQFFYFQVLNDMKPNTDYSGIGSINANGYHNVTSAYFDSHRSEDKMICLYNNGYVRFTNFAYTTISTFKAAMSGVLLYYETIQGV